MNTCGRMGRTGCIFVTSQAAVRQRLPQRACKAQLDPHALRVFVKLDAVNKDKLVQWLQQVIAVVAILVFAVQRRPVSGQGKPVAELTAKIAGAGVARENIKIFTTETFSEVAPDAFLTLLFSKYAGRRNYLITETAETPRRRWFEELLALTPTNQVTVWLGSDFQVQGRTKKK